MKIGILGIRGIPANYGGFETCAEETSKRWVKGGINVYVYCRKHWYDKRPTVFKNVNLIYTWSLKTKSLDTFSHTFISFICLLISRNGINTIHLYNTGNGTLVPLIKLFGKKVIISVDGLEWKRAKWGIWGKLMHKLGEYLASWFADAVIADNEEVENYYNKKFPKANVKLIKYGAKTIKPNSNLSRELLSNHDLTRGEYFIFVGRLVPEKGVHNLIESYKLLETNWPLVIIGDDHVDSSYKQSLLKHNSKKIKFLGFRYNEEYEQLLANAYLYVSASSLEGTSPSLLSAMGAGVCALVNGINENYYTVDNAAFTFRENNYEDLTHVWQKLVLEPESVTRMALKGESLVKKKYSWDKISEQYLNILQ